MERMDNLMANPEARARSLLDELYGEEQAEQLWPQFDQRLQAFHRQFPYLQERHVRFSQHDAWLITYGDQVQEPERPPLESLAGFMETHLGTAINGVHILPFFPYSSDDGFSVVDYREVNPELGSWSDISRLDANFRLMFDAVINHVSAESEWFQGFRQGKPPYSDYFICVDPDEDLSMVVRPRALPLLTAVDTDQGMQMVWTTFSEDQIDLNYANPQVLLAISDLLLFYVSQGAEIIRLDAIAYLWKEPGTPSIHLPQTHAVVKLWRALLDSVAPGVILITETNVPHAENVSYFGQPLGGSRYTDEAQMVYQFPLAPLAIHAFTSGDASVLREWAAGLETPAPAATFFNFIASHDGIGVRPAEGLLTPEQIQALVDRTLGHGGQVSYKQNQDGSKSVYELNITLYDLLNNPARPEPAMDVARFLASQALMLSLAGVPGIYFNSLFGMRNCQSCLEDTGRPRSLNRKKFQRPELEALLTDEDDPHSQVFHGYIDLLCARRAHPAFHPAGEQQVLPVEPGQEALFALVRHAPEDDDLVLCLINAGPQPLELELGLQTNDLPEVDTWRSLVNNAPYPATDGNLALQLDGYETLWLTPDDG